MTADDQEVDITVSPSEGTPEVVAYALMRQHLADERRKRIARGNPDWQPSKDWLLATYAEFLACVTGQQRPAEGEIASEPDAIETTPPAPKRRRRSG